ncbi:efflux RND transporter periplasmic adaptor subunit [Paraburkholderia nemoris]|uniref:efflux RND transporter periplasmic adaptor subunit n=1 Tax=Paraburkholderia nemoris TaxID=2793076 RepID=UPI0038B99637
MKRYGVKASLVGVVMVIGGALSVGLVHDNRNLAISNASAADAPTAVEVDVAPVIARCVTDWQSYSGRLQAVDHVDVRPLVPGTITAVNFKDGAVVKKGDLLFTIDSRPYIAEVDRAKAQLQAANTRAAYAASDAKRADRLMADNAIAKRDLEAKQNSFRVSDADVSAARAALETALINLGYTRVTAPISGRLSRAELTVGNVVSAGAGAPILTKIVSISPIYASFDVDEQTYLQYLNKVHGAKIPVSLGLSDESGYPRTGYISSVDNELNTSSGTIRVRAVFDNPDDGLLPGLSARVKVGGGQKHQAILVDDAAIGTDQDKRYVLVVDGSKKVRYREVTVGAPYDGLRSITSGLSVGDQVVVNGMQRVQPGAQVRVHQVTMTATSPGAA